MVTGGAGYIGSHMVFELIDAGEALVVLDNISTGYRWAVADSVPLIVGDIADSGLVEGIITEHSIDSIVHFAGSIVVPESIADPLCYYLNNTVRSHSLIKSAVKMNIRNFIFSSTAAVYGLPKSNPVYENAELAPISPYGSSKLMTEMILADTSRV